jgi:hypothetical protein
MALYPKKGKKYRATNRQKVSRVDKLVKQAKKAIDDAAKEQSKLKAEGVAIHSVVNSRTSTNVLDNVNDLQNPDLQNRAKVIDLSRKLRQAEGICGSVADLLTDFAITRGSFYSDNVELKDILNKWSKFVNSTPALAQHKGMVFPVPGIRALSRKIFDDYIVDGDAVFTLFWQNGVKMDPAGDGDALFLPTSIKVIDTTTLTVDVDLARFGVEQLILKLDDKVKERILNPVSDADKYLKENIPKEWLKQISAGEDIILDPNVTFHVKRNAKDYRAWGQSYFLKAFGAVAAKRRLQAVDDATIDGLINRFTIFKLGLEDREKNPAYHIPSTARVAALVNILTSQKRSNAAVWPGPDLDVIDIGPDGKILEFDQKYKQADIDILRALHVSPLLIDGTTSGQVADDFISFLSTEVGLDAIRSELEAIFTTIAKEIALANNLEYENLYYKFETQLLKDQERVKNFALKVFELGGISVETFVETMGYDFPAEKQLKETEDTDGTKDLFKNENVPGFTGVAPTGPKEGEDPDIVDKDGRPPKEPSEEAATAVNSLDNVTAYFSLYKQTFDKIGADMSLRQKLNPDDFDFAMMSLVGGFAHFRMLVRSQLAETYRTESGGNITEDLQVLYAWNDHYIDRFYDNLKTEITASPSDFDTILKDNEYRVFMYATESYRKAMWVGKIARARIERFTKGIWKCNKENSKCIKNHGQSFDLDYLVQNFPGHPNCKCEIEFV